MGRAWFSDLVQVRDLCGVITDASVRPVEYDRLRLFVVHRIDFSQDDGGDNHFRGVFPVPRDKLYGDIVARRFTDVRRVHKRERDWRDRPGSYTGGEVPYTFLGKYAGGVDQLIPLTDYAPHARRWSTEGVSYAVAGDFRERDAPTAEQWLDLVRMAALFVSFAQRPVSDVVVGHDELPGAAAGKECPGRNLSMSGLRDEVRAHRLASMTRQQAEGFMMALGINITGTCVPRDHIG